MTTHSDKTRRQFLKDMAVGAVLAQAGPLAASLGATETLAKSTVVVARDAQLYGSSATPDSARVAKLLDSGMQSLFNSADPVSPWKKLFKPSEVVGLKINTIAGPGLSTNLVLIEAISERLKQAGIKPANIVVWDRYRREFEHLKFKTDGPSTDVRFLTTDLPNIGFDDTEFSVGPVKTRLSKLLTQTCDAMINLPVLKNHSLAGVTFSMKNMYGVNHNPGDMHADNCCPFVADLNLLPPIRSKFRLIVGDAMTACYEGGPGFKPEYTWRFNGLILATDPVAADQTAWQFIEQKRAAQGLKTLADTKRPPKYIAVAADPQHRLGTNDPSRIHLLEV